MQQLLLLLLLPSQLALQHSQVATPASALWQAAMPAWQCKAGQAVHRGVPGPPEGPSTYHTRVLGSGDAANGMPLAALAKNLESKEEQPPPPATHYRQSSQPTLTGETVEGTGSKDLESNQQQPPPAVQPNLGSSSSLPAPLSTPELLFWVMVAAAQPVCVAMIGVLVRYLEASC